MCFAAGRRFRLACRRSCRSRWPVRRRASTIRAASISGSRPIRSGRCSRTLPIDLFADAGTAPLLADQVRGRIVLIGGDLPDRDQFEIPSTRLRRPDDERAGSPRNDARATARRPPAQPAGSPSLWALAILVVLCGAFTAMLDVRPWVVALAVLGQLVFFGGAPFLFEWRGIDTYGLPAFGWLGGWMLAYAATGAAVRAVGSEQRRYAQSALGKYLPRDIAAQILRDPAKLSLTGEKRAIYTLFTDIEGFTRLSHRLPPERVATLLNAYLDGMSDIVLDHGGTIDKFVGDAVVAFWGAPIAREDDADRAAAALLAMNVFTREFSAKHNEDGAQLGRTRVGPSLWRCGRRQFRRRRAAQLHRARRRDELRRAARRRQQISEDRRADQRRGEEPHRPRRLPADGPDHPVRPGDADRGVGTRARHGCQSFVPSLPDYGTPMMRATVPRSTKSSKFA